MKLRVVLLLAAGLLALAAFGGSAVSDIPVAGSLVVTADAADDISMSNEDPGAGAICYDCPCTNPQSYYYQGRWWSCHWHTMENYYANRYVWR